MSKDIKIRKGLSINLKGKAKHELSSVSRSKIYAINPPDFYGVIPKMVVKAGEKVKAGDVVFFDKKDEQIKFTSPVSGEIREIIRGARRRILSIKIIADTKDQFKDLGAKNPSKMDAIQVKEFLLQTGCWAYIKQRPYDIMANPADTPKAIFISAYATAPLAAEPGFALQGKEKEFQAGIDAISKLTAGKVHLGVGSNDSSFLNNIKGVEIHKVSGKHPAGNVGVQISKIDPINAGERVWVLKPVDVAIIGQTLLTGKYSPSKVIALAGSQVKDPKYYEIIQGAQIKDIVDGKLKEGKSRIISGDPLTGMKVTPNDSIGFYDTEITVLPEGDKYRFFGWMPFFGNDKFSMSRTFFSFLTPNKEYDLDTNMNGEERAMVVTGEMEKVMPIDIYPMQLIKAVLAGDIEKMENLGIYEVAPEDFALIDFVSSSKLEAQDIIRQGIDLMIKEVG
ncbi:MAG: NADH:ubiquinone reductase (Na(+)-transporting) subunit A [Flavobacteriia bacterium]|nr:MAG: NADH:ubiquinone reductase (Na(+)-transporting) subunit A [Flavobacteriia bacterium]